MTPFDKYQTLLEVLIRFKKTDLTMLDSRESDIIRNMMDPFWHELTEEEMERIEKWAQEYEASSNF